MDDTAARERRLRWLVFGGVTLALVFMAVIFIIIGKLA